MSCLATAGLAIFFLLLFAGIFLSLFGLPGAILIFVDVLVYAVFTDFYLIDWKILLLLFIIAVTAEIIDFLIDISGGLKPENVMKSILASAIGAFTGACILAPFFWGPGIWVGFFLGGCAGILIFEYFQQLKLKKPFRATNREIFIMIGRMLAKGFISLFMIAVSLSHIYS